MQGFTRGALRAAVLACALAATAAFAAGGSRQQQIDALVRSYHDLQQFNGAVLVADAKGVVHKKGYGLANFEWQVPVTPDTRFRIGSVTKQFTAIVVLQLVSEGKLKLDGKVTDYLPDYRKDTGARVTLHHLLNHTSGIPSYTSHPGFFRDESRTPYPVADFVKKFCSGDLEFEPGSRFRYNNSGYFLLGAIIEKVTGMPYAQAVQTRLLDPVGMKHSGYDLHGPLIAKRASGYELRRATPVSPGPGAPVNAPYLDMGLPYAAGSLYSTVEDLYLWDRALYTGKLLPAELEQKMYTPGLENYGYGWTIAPMTLEDGKTQVATLRHGGGINGFSAFFVRAPERKELVVLLDNTSTSGKLEAMTRGILGILRGQPAKPARRSVADALSPLLEKGTAADAVAKYRALQKAQPDAYDFGEGELNRLGYQLLQRGRTAEAVEVFKLNVEVFPKRPNPHDSLGEAYVAAGERALALESYRRALALDPKSEGAAEAVARLEKPAAASKYPLEAYVGSYALAPNMVLEVLLEQGRLVAAPTGQPRLALVADGASSFAVTGAPVRIEFVVDEAAKRATSLVMHQGDRKMPAPRVK